MKIFMQQKCTLIKLCIILVSFNSMRMWASCNLFTMYGVDQKQIKVSALAAVIKNVSLRQQNAAEETLVAEDYQRMTNNLLNAMQEAGYQEDLSMSVMKSLSCFEGCCSKFIIQKRCEFTLDQAQKYMQGYQDAQSGYELLQESVDDGSF